MASSAMSGLHSLKPTLHLGILHIHSLITLEQVTWIAAGWIITAMQDALAGFDLPMEDPVGYAMSKMIPAKIPYNAIPIFIRSRRP